MSSSELYLSTLSAELVGQYSVGARGSGCLGAVGVPDGSCASWSGSSLLVDGHAHARPPQSGHLFHDSSFVFVSLRGLFLALFPATEWSCFSLVSECIGRGLFLSSSTGRVGAVGGFGGGVAVGDLVRGILRGGWALWVGRLPSRLSQMPRVGVLLV